MTKQPPLSDDQLLEAIWQLGPSGNTRFSFVWPGEARRGAGSAEDYEKGCDAAVRAGMTFLGGKRRTGGRAIANLF